jgi:hypothetical protein
MVASQGTYYFEEVSGESRAPLSRMIAQEFDVSDELARDVVRMLGYVTKWEMFTTPAEGNVSISAIIEALDHPQSDVQMRSVARCIMYIMSSDDRYVDDCYAALLAFIRKGHGHWLVNEQIIKWAGRYIDNDELLIDATKLPDGDNRKHAYWALGAKGHPYLLDAVFTEDNAEALSGLVSALIQEGYRGFFRGGPKGFKGYLPGRHVTYFLLEKLTHMLNEDETVFTRYHAADALKTVVRYANAQGFDLKEADAALDAYEQGRRRNPEEPSAEEDDEWLALAKQHMLAVVEG